jgi:hypothetical protein
MIEQQPKSVGGRPSKTGFSENPVSFADAGIDKNLADRALLGSRTVHPVRMCQHVPSHQAEDEEHNHSGHDPHRPHVGLFGIWLILLRHGDFLFARGWYRPWSSS